MVVDDVGAPDGVCCRLCGFSAGHARPRHAVGADTPRSLVWVDRTGRETPIGAPLHIYSTPRLSPDGTRIAVTIREQQNDIHVFDLKRRTLMRLAASSSRRIASDLDARWPAHRVCVGARTARRICTHRRPTGPAAVERLTTGPDPQVPGWVAPDGSGILGSEISPTTAGDVVWFPLKAPVQPVRSECGIQLPGGTTRAFCGDRLFPRGLAQRTLRRVPIE